MFGLGMGEIVLILIVALLFLGPEKLPTAAKTIGKTIRGLRRQTRELTKSLEGDNEFGDAVREIRSALRDEPPYRAHLAPTKNVVQPSDDDHEGVEAADGAEPAHDGASEPHMEHDVDPGAPVSASATSESGGAGVPRIGPAPGAIARGSDPAPAEETAPSSEASTKVTSDHG